MKAHCGKEGNRPTLSEYYLLALVMIVSTAPLLRASRRSCETAEAISFMMLMT